MDYSRISVDATCMDMHVDDDGYPRIVGYPWPSMDYLWYLWIRLQFKLCKYDLVEFQILLFEGN